MSQILVDQVAGIVSEHRQTRGHVRLVMMVVLIAVSSSLLTAGSAAASDHHDVVDTADYAQGTAINGNFLWRGFTFTVPHDVLLESLYGARTNGTGTWRIALFEAPQLEMEGLSPDSLVAASALVPGVFVEVPVDPVVLTPDKVYLVAQGRADNGDGYHHEVLDVDASALEAQEAGITAWRPADGSSFAFAISGTEWDVLNTPASLNGIQPRLGIGIALADPPEPPEDLNVALEPMSGDVTLSWDAPAADGGSAVTSYAVYRGRLPTDLEFLAELHSSQTSFVESGLQTGTWFYGVTANNTVGESDKALERFDMRRPGALWGWGRNSGWQLGDGTTTDRLTPVPALDPAGDRFLRDVVHFSTGHHNHFLKTDGTLWGWGPNYAGQIGDGTLNDAPSPVRVVGPGGDGFLEDITQVSSHNRFTIALRDDGTVWAWGNGVDGKLGQGNTADSLVPVQVRGPGGVGFLQGIVEVSAGGSRVFAVGEDGSLWAWGANHQGRLGDGTMSMRTTPVQVRGPGGDGFFEGVVQAFAGPTHSIALKEDGTVWTWGWNRHGQLGDGTTSDSLTPVQVKGPGGVGFLHDVVQVAGGFHYSLAVKSDGTAWTWGNNGGGRLGDGTTTERHTPVQVLGVGGSGALQDIVRIDGFWESYARGGDGDLYAWGFNGRGQLGDGTTDPSAVPVTVVSPAPAFGLDKGEWHAMALLPYAPPGLPLNVTATDGPGAGQITVSWDTPEDDGGAAVSGYRLYGSDTSGGPYSLVESVGQAVFETTENEVGNAATRHYVVVAENDAGEGILSAEVSATTGDVPSAPLNLTADRGPGTGEITLSWDPPIHDGGFPVTSYIVYRGSSSDSLSILDNISTIRTTYTDAGLDPGTTLFYQVTAVNEAGESPRSVIASATTYDTPGAPQVLGVTTGPSVGTLTLEWSAPASDGGLPVETYHVYGADATGGPYTHLAILQAPAFSFKETGLGNGVIRHYVVSAENGAGEGPQSQEASGTTFDVPGAPQNLRAVSGPSVGEVSLQWEAPLDDGGLAVTHYLVYRGNTSGGPYGLLVTFNGTVFVDTGLGIDDTRYYVVSAVNPAGEGPHSDEVATTTFSTPGAPQGLTVSTGAAPGTIDLVWQAPEDDGGLPITGYNVYGSGSSSGPFGTVASTNGTSFQDSGLGDSVARFYQVRAENEAGEGAPSGPLGSSTQPAEDPEPLPEGRSATGAIWQGHYAYVFAGRDSEGNPTDTIQRFDPAENEVVVLAVSVPSPRLGVSAVWVPGVDPDAEEDGPDGLSCHPSCPMGRGFIFGGLGDSLEDQSLAPHSCHPSCPAGKQILIFDPEEGEITESSVGFVEERFGTSAVFASMPGQEEEASGPSGSSCHPSCPAETVYIFGGFPVETSMQAQEVFPRSCHPSCPVGSQIFEYDPVGDTLEQHDATLPEPLGGTSAIWDPGQQVAYIFGGRPTLEAQAEASSCDPGCSASIFRFDPSVSQVDVLPVEFPSDRWNTSAVFDGRYAYVIGGENENGLIDEIVRFDPVDMAVELVGTLPSERAQTSAVFDGKDAYVFGGKEAGENSTDEITRFTPRAPQETSAEAGPGPGQVTVSWSAPSNDGGEPVVAYRVYRSFGGQGTFLLVADLAVDELLGASDRDLLYIDGGLADSAVYDYRVSAVNVVGEGPQSPGVPVRTFGVPDVPQDVTTLPGPAWGEITVRWEVPGSDGGAPVLAYNVYRADGSGGPYTLIGSDATGGRLFIDSGLDDLDTRYYVVKAVNVVGEGASSAEATGQTFDPLNLYVAPGGITLQQAADVVAPGGTIHVAPGVYTEEVVLSTSATIRPGVADGPGPGALGLEGPSVIEGSVHVEGASSFVLEDVQIEATKGGSLKGIALYTQGVASVEVLNTTFHGDGESKGPGFFPGLVDLRGVQTLRFTDNSIVGDPAVPGSPSGLRVHYAQHGDLSIQVENNGISALKGAGIALTGNNLQASIDVSGNALLENGDGLNVFNAVFGDLSVTRNEVMDHEGVGVRFTGSVEGGPVLRYNTFVGNGVGLSSSGGLGSVDARHNWWGHAGGPLAGDQAAMLAVDYTPWCVQASCGLDEDLVDPVLP